MAEAILAPGGIYTISNKVNGKKYVGSSIELTVRQRTHFWHLRKGTHINVKLQRAWAKYGEEALVFDVIERVPDQLKLLEREQFWMDALKTTGSGGYNIALRAGNTLGYKMDRAIVERLRKLRIGKKFGPPSAETRAKISAKAQNQSLERRLRVAETLRGRKFSDERRAKIKAKRALQVMRPMTDETKKKISEARLAGLARRRAKGQLELF